MRFYVGTSGWSYSWNRERSLIWYLENTPFNTVELNASFYRFPYKSYIKSWKMIAEQGIRFSIKAHRLITHTYHFDERSFDVWDKIKRTFEVLDEHIYFYLFQLPPSFKPDKKHIERIKRFVEYTKIGKRFALEFRNNLWFNNDLLKDFEDITLVSVSAPKLPEIIFHNNKTVYMRFHGRVNWNKYTYSKDELMEIYHKIKNLDNEVEEAYLYFNNDTGMFDNAIMMSKICGL